MKTILQDYLLSVIIYFLIFGCIALYYKFHNNHEGDITISYNPGSSIEDSKNNHKYLGCYVLDKVHSEINEYNYVPDQTLWFEKRSMNYFRTTSDGGKVFLTDSIFRDTILCFPTRNDPGYSSFWVDKEKHDTIYKYPDYPYRFIEGFRRYPDSLLLIVLQEKTVYKGTICLTKE